MKFSQQGNRTHDYYVYFITYNPRLLRIYIHTPHHISDSYHISYQSLSKYLIYFVNTSIIIYFPYRNILFVYKTQRDIDKIAHSTWHNIVSSFCIGFALTCKNMYLKTSKKHKAFFVNAGFATMYVYFKWCLSKNFCTHSYILLV